MKRLVSAAMGMLALVAAACQPPQPPSGYVPPVIDSITLSAPTVAAGSIIGITVRAHDDGTIRAATHDGFVLPQRVALPTESTSCTPYTVTPDGPGAVIATASCVVPAFATNGSWTVRVTVLDTEAYWGTTGEAVFEVTGGTDDVTGPSTESVQYSPSPVVTATQVFTATARVSDPHGPVFAPRGCCPPSLFGAPFTAIPCGLPTVVQVSPTQADVSIQCTGQASNPSGVYQGVVAVTDALGNRSDVLLQVTVA